MGLVLDRLGNWLGRMLSRPVHVHGSAAPTPPELLLACLRPGDVLLAEGGQLLDDLYCAFSLSEDSL